MRDRQNAIDAILKEHGITMEGLQAKFNLYAKLHPEGPDEEIPDCKKVCRIANICSNGKTLLTFGDAILSGPWRGRCVFRVLPEKPEV